MQQDFKAAAQHVRGKCYIQNANCEVDTCFGQMWRCLSELSTMLAYDMNCH